MKTQKQPFYKRLLNSYRLWRSNRNQKILNTMVAYTMDEAIRLANKKRDIINMKVWAVSGSAEYLVFARYQKKQLQLQKLLKPNITGKDLDEMASFVALPVTNKDKSRGGILRRFIGNQTGLGKLFLILLFTIPQCFFR